MLFHAVLPTPLGPFTLSADHSGLCAISFPGDAPPVAAEARVDLPSHPLLAEAGRQLLAYLEQRRRDFDLPLCPRGTDFQQRVWAELRTIPYGRTLSYGELADRVGGRRMARAVGGAAHANPLAIVIPCHRLIGAGGSLTGFGGGLDMKRTLLALEAETAKKRA